MSDQTVQLGQQDNTVTVRLVVYQNARGEKWSYITSRLDLEPYLIVELYGLRWEIETFFLVAPRGYPDPSANKALV